MIVDPNARISPEVIEALISELEVQFVWLSYCLVSPGFRLEMGDFDYPGIHYNISGRGRMLIVGREPIDLEPHTLIVVPNNSAFKIEVADEVRNEEELKTINWQEVIKKKCDIYEFVAGNAQTAEVNLVCGFFKASYGQTTDLFTGLQSPIIEQFSTADRLGDRLSAAVLEFLGREIGSDAISGMLLKQVIILLLRRSLVSVDLWLERFAILRDARIAKVFAAMTADPGGPHTIKSLADIACMSRSSFMSTFTSILGKSPMATLRDLRMRHATRLLKQSHLSIDQVSQGSGYDSKTSFNRVFRQVYGKYPNEYRAELFKSKEDCRGDDSKS